MRVKSFKRAVNIIIAVIFAIALVGSIALSEPTSWDCPECGRTGNTGSFCGNCGQPVPTVTPLPTPEVTLPPMVIQPTEKPVRAGEIISFGRFEQDNNTDNGTETIEWIVLDVNEKDNLSESEVIILASGNLAMIYLTQWHHRLTYEEITSKFPNLLPGIVDNEYVGFVLVRSKEKGDMAIGLEGTYYLDSDEIEGKNPLEGYGKNVVSHLKRNSNFDHTPDILVISFYDPVANEVCAFEELVGSHGGVGGEQSRPFILYPSSWDVSSDDIIGAESIYKILKTNSNNLKK